MHVSAKFADFSLWQIVLFYENNKNLTGVNLEGCCDVTDKGVEVLATHNKNLTTVNLTYTGVTDIGVEVLATHNKNLTSVNLDDTGVSFEMINKLRNKGIIVYG